MLFRSRQTKQFNDIEQYVLQGNTRQMQNEAFKAELKSWMRFNKKHQDPIGKKKGQRYIKTWKHMEPLMIAVLKSLTPNDIETNFMDDRNELINYDEKTDFSCYFC